MKAKGKALVRNMLQMLCSHIRTKNLISSNKMCREPVTPAGSYFAASTWLLKSKMCFADMCEDEGKSSLFQRVRLTTIEKDLLREEEGVV